MTHRQTVAVFGATGFIGLSAVHALEARGSQVMQIPTPRVRRLLAPDVADFVRDSDGIRCDLATSLGDADVVVNAAGVPDAASKDEPELNAANAACAALLASAAREHGVRRFVHVSTAAVQGYAETLDDTTHVQPFSAYSRSKALGERLVAEFGPDECVIYRPPGVHGAGRPVTRAIHRIAKTPISTTAAPGSAPSPQALIRNVGDALAFLALYLGVPPSIVIHPWEGITTRDLLLRLGGREPHLLHPGLARAALTVLETVSRGLPRFDTSRRRLEMLWFGQAQAPSWLSHVGWVPPLGLEGWDLLSSELSAPPRAAF